MNSTATKLSKCLAAVAFVALAPLAHAAPTTPFTDFDGTLYVGLLDQFNDTISISVGGFAVGGSYTFSFALIQGDEYNSSNLSLVFADFAPTTQDLFGLSIFFNASASSETLTFDYPGATTDLDFVEIVNGLIVCTDNCTPVTPVPEPGTMALVGLALAGMGFAARRRKTA